jgi:AcrR family transcriptional regulator
VRRDAQRNRERILAAAGDLFAERGVGASLDDVAAAAGVGVGTVYRHYPTKDALLDELFEAKVEELAAGAEAAASEPDSWMAFAGFLQRLTEAFVANRALEAVMLHPDRRRQRIEHARERLEEPVLAIVERAKADGNLAPAFAPEDIGVIHTMLAAVVRETHAEDPELWRRYFALVLSGLAAQARGVGQPM